MTSHDTPTREATSSLAWREARGTRTVATRTRDAQRLPDPHRSSSWLVWVGIVAALAAAIWLVIAGVADQSEAARSARSDRAYSARLQGLADQYLEPSSHVRTGWPRPFGTGRAE